ncbi:MAG: hypothetical protein ACI4PM_05755 [Butyricicoccus sp.]
MKKGYHSVQTKIYQTIPRSEFFGIALGFAFGLIASGVFHASFELVGAACGFTIGWLIDRLFFLVKDVPEENPPALDTSKSDEQ